MDIQVNGNPQSITGPVTIKDYLVQAGLVPEHVVVEINREIVTKNLWEQTAIHPGDSLEIVHFVGGG